MAIHNEIEFENELCDYLAKHGWLYSPDDTGYDKSRSLFPADIFGWLEDTQAAELAKVGNRDQLLDRIAKQLDTPLAAGGGTLNMLRGTVKHVSARFSMCQFKPNTTQTATTVENYGKVRVRVMRQVHYSLKNAKKSIDLVLFVNGLPVATMELKTDNTQSVADAIAQYRTDREPVGEPLLGFGTRALVHFAVSNEEVYMATKLAGKHTFFLPFNMGSDGASGNPLNPHGSATSYLWERVLDRDAWLRIIGKLMHLQITTEIDPITGAKSKKTTLLFPRFHQWDAVTKLLDAARAEGPGHKYLVQHSAGSGKTNSIAWTAHGLANLHDDANKKTFDSVIVVTDRTVLDDQLREAVKQIEPTEGVVVTVAHGGGDSKSKKLADALIAGRHIIVVTLQTFPFALKAIRETKGLADKNFAVIADEAHSSQTGDAANNLKKVLTAAEQADLEDGAEVDVQDQLVAEMEARAESKNISYFAFTATPKSKTLEHFGRSRGAGQPPVPFHVYTMQQAIEEGFILDVLRNYTSFDTAYELATSDEAKDVDSKQATKSLIRWAKLHPTNITQKVAIVVEHFRENVEHLIDGHAKAMVVCDSRIAAVRYKNAFDKYIGEQGYEIAALVAFSGDDVPGLDPVEDGKGPFNEKTMNPGLKGRSVREAFASGDEYRVMLVANKFQTGFDQPLLCAMYVDKRLSDVLAVQTLSRLNRTYSKGGKDTTYVLDFVNDPYAVLEDFKKYYRDAALTDTTDPNLIHDLQNTLDAAGIYTDADVVAVSDVLVKEASSSKEALHNALEAVLAPPAKVFHDRWDAADDDKEERLVLEQFRKNVGSFIRLYDFLSQMINYGDTDLERRSIFFKKLIRRIQTAAAGDPFDTSDVSIAKLKVIKREEADLKLGQGDPLKPITALGTARAATDPKMVAMSEVIDSLNERFGDEEFTRSQQQSWVETNLRELLSDPTLVTQAKNNRLKQFLESPQFKDAVAMTLMDNQQAFDKMTDIAFNDVSFHGDLVESLGKLFHLWATTPDEDAEDGDEQSAEESSSVTSPAPAPR